MTSGDPKYLKLLDDMRELHIKKNAGYAGDSTDRWANFRMAEGFGVSAFVGCLIRLSDKFIRIQNLVKNPSNEKVGESLKDTLLDMASYALIAYCLLDEQENEYDSSTSIYTPDEWADRCAGIDRTSEDDEELENPIKNHSQWSQESHGIGRLA